MNFEESMPSVLDFAYEIIAIHKENLWLRERIEHLEELDKIHMDSIKSQEKHNAETFGIIISAALDPDSAINQGHAALLREQAAATDL